MVDLRVCSAVPTVVDECQHRIASAATDALSLSLANRCGHCKSLAPEYEIAATAFSKLQNRAIIASVDADAHKSLGGRFEVKGFPTLKWFPAGSLEPEAYSGGRTAKDIVEFVNGKAGTNARISAAKEHTVVLTPENFDKIVLDSNKDVLVEFCTWMRRCHA